MNFLELCKRTRQECGISGIGPVTTQNQQGEMKMIVDWVREAFIDIQNAAMWNFLWRNKSQDLIAGQRVISPITDLLIDPIRFDYGTFKLHDTAVGIDDEQFLNYVHWDDFKRTFEISFIQTSRPSFFTIDPAGNIRLDCYTLQPFTLSFRYYTAPQELALDADIPLMPNRFQMAIVWQAVMYYAGYEEAGSVMQIAQANFRRYMGHCMNEQTPDLMMPGPLV